jgi:hypothetical protein
MNQPGNIASGYHATLANNLTSREMNAMQDEENRRKTAEREGLAFVQQQWLASMQTEALLRYLHDEREGMLKVAQQKHLCASLEELRSLLTRAVFLGELIATIKKGGFNG